MIFVSVARKSLLREPSLAGGVDDDLLDELEDSGGAFGDVGIFIEDLGGREVVFDPGSTVVVLIHDERHEAIHSVGEFRFGGFASFKFLPQCQKFLSLIDREVAEDPLGGGEFSGGEVGVLILGVVEDVATLNFGEIVDGEHFDHTEQVNWFS